VSLAHPWLPLDEAVAAIGRLDAALAGQEPLPVRFERSERFRPDGRGRTTVHLPLGDPGPVQELARTLGLALPLPHLSVIRLPVDGDAVHRAEEAIAGHLPLAAVVRTAQLRIRYGSWWRVEHVAHLGGGPTGAAGPHAEPPRG
jgi:hypothetical protein